MDEKQIIAVFSLDEKKYKIIILILAIAFCISTGLCIYFGRNNASRTGEELTLTIKENERIIADNKRTILELQSDLSGARKAIESANERAGDAERRAGLAIEFAERTASGIDSVAAGTGNLVEKQQLIITIFERIKSDYRQLKERLRNSS